MSRNIHVTSSVGGRYVSLDMVSSYTAPPADTSTLVLRMTDGNLVTLTGIDWRGLALELLARTPLSTRPWGRIERG